MISICIPVFNFDVGPLLKALRHQINGGTRAEIILIDDASSQPMAALNQRHLPLADHFLRLPENIGRAAIRNRFAAIALFDHLLFLDCDVMPVGDQFLNTYATQLFPNRVLCGGRQYPQTIPDEKYRLRWNYGQKLESSTANLRSVDPYSYFQTNNFLVPKTVLKANPFDESINGYGYEDSMFSYSLKLHGVDILHLDNPVINMHVESNERFMEQTDQAMRNLARLTESFPLEDVVRLAAMYKSAKELLNVVPSFAERWLRKQVIKHPMELKAFQLYKLLAYTREKKNH